MVPKTTPLQEKHALEFLLELIKTKKGGAQTVGCLFCIYDRRDKVEVGSSTGRKRKSRVDIKCYTKPFAPQNYRSHNKMQHGKAWAEYSELRNAEKREYFTGKTKIVNTLHHCLDVEGDTMEFKVSPPIIETIIGDMFFRNDEMLDNAEDDDKDDLVASDAAKAVAKKIAKKSTEKAHAMKMFVKDSETEKYVITIKNVMRYELALDHVGSGMSFRQAAMAIEQAKRRTQTPKLADINSLMVGQFIRALVVSNLKRIADFMGDASVWAFSFACNSSTHRGQSFFDMRLRFCYRSVLVNLNLFAIPMFDRHTSQIIFDTVCKFMDALYGSGRGKLLCVASDGKNAMTGCHAGSVTQLCAVAEHLVLRIWCAPHQIDLKMKHSSANVFHSEWVAKAHAFSVFLRAQNSLITEMNVKCPKLTFRWVQYGIVLIFFITHRRRMVNYAADHQKFVPPSPFWWIMTYAASPAISSVNKTVVVLQNKAILIAQQYEHIVNLIGSLVAIFSIGSTDEPMDGYLVNGSMRIAYADIVAHIEHQGSWPMQLLAALSDDEKLDVVREVTTYAMNLVLGLQSVRAEYDANNLPRAQDAPPVLPAHLVKLSP
uniref:DUF4371 domain-containing protein n=1 Tax=Hyaloperonospora arabidopsidis (strain Emoy2) TaxID=559515 RepID=M4BQY7_HYAAE